MPSLSATGGVGPAGVCRSVGLRRTGGSCGGRRGSCELRRSNVGQRGDRGGRKRGKVAGNSPENGRGFAPFLGARGTRWRRGDDRFIERYFAIGHWILGGHPMELRRVARGEWMGFGNPMWRYLTGTRGGPEK
nr:hypothetical protein Iba_chr07dCG13340 [Ipomoea batatas]